MVVLAVLAVAAIAGYLTFRNFTAFPGEADYFSVLLIGEDRSYLRNGEAVSAPGRMDAIMVLAMPRKGGPSLLMSIPRDTLVRYPDGQVRRVNVSMGAGGISLARQVVSELTGLEMHSMCVNFDGFIHLVDALGGVDIQVDQRMQSTGPGATTSTFSPACITWTARPPSATCATGTMRWVTYPGPRASDGS